MPHISRHLLCMLEWLLSGHSSVCVNHSTRNFKGWLKKTPNRWHFQLYRYLAYRLHSGLKPAWVLYGFGLCRSNHILEINEKNVLVTRSPSRDRESLGTKQTQAKPNANRGWPIKPAKYIQTQLSRLCPNLSGLQPHNMQMGHSHCQIVLKWPQDRASD